MKFRGLLVAAIVLAALTGTLYWSNHRKPPESTGTASADTPPKILALNPTDITGLEIKKKTGEVVTLDKTDAGQWQITAPVPLAADQEAVSSMLSALSSLNSDRLVDDKATNLDQYGLVPASIEVDITKKDKTTVKLLIGDNTPAGSGAYTAVSGDPRVFTLATYNKSNFDKNPNDLRDKRLLNFDSDKLSRVELSAKKQIIEFGRSKDQWQIVKPKPFRADGFQVDELVRSVHDAKMELSGTDDGKKTAAAFNSGSAIATVKVTDISGTQELQVRKNKDDYYAKSSATAGVYKITSATATALDKSLDDFRNRKLFDFGYADLDKIEIHDGAKNFVVSRSGADWLSNGTKMDGPSVTTLIGAIRDLSATKFPDGGFTGAAIELTITSNDGKRIEKVALSKNNESYVARRENEPAFYEVAASSVAELQKAAAELKPAVVKPALAPTKK
jgi:hypothetical protein